MTRGPTTEPSHWATTTIGPSGPIRARRDPTCKTVSARAAISAYPSATLLPARSALAGLSPYLGPLPNIGNGPPGVAAPRPTRSTAWLGHVPAGLSPNFDKAKHRSGNGQDEHDPERDDEEGREQETETKGNEPLGPLHKAALGLKPETLSLGPLIGNQGCRYVQAKGQQRHSWAVRAGQIPASASKQQTIA